MTREHRLMFNVTSVGRDEDIYLAELRLLTLVETDRSLYDGVNRRVTVYELGAAPGNSTAAGQRQIASKLIYGRSSGWETFTVTEAVRRWVRLRATAQVTQMSFLCELVFLGITPLHVLLWFSECNASLNNAGAVNVMFHLS